MRKVFSIVAATLFAGAAIAEEAMVVPGPVLSGEVALDFAETAAGDWGGSMGVDLDITAAGLAYIDLEFDATQGEALELDDYTVGTSLAGVGIAFGNDNGVFVGAEGEQTLADPDMAESIEVTVGDAAVAVGFTDWTADITDISNIQGSYTIDAGVALVTAAGDYNMDSENIVVGAEVAGVSVGEVALGGAVTYDTDAEMFAFEGVAGAMGLTAYVNGDQDDAFQNIGGDYTLPVAGAELTAGVNYDVEAEEFTPTVGVSFSF